MKKLLFAFIAVIMIAASESHQESAANSEAKDAPAEHVSAAAVPKAPAPAAQCLTDPSVLEDLKGQREALEAKQKEIAALEQELKQREKIVEEKLKALEATRQDIEKVDEARKKEDDLRVAKIVETLETMSPKASSLVLAQVDESLASAVMAKIATPKLAKILNGMDPKRASRLSELYSGKKSDAAALKKVELSLREPASSEGGKRDSKPKP